jgi:hypothetical protein
LFEEKTRGKKSHDTVPLNHHRLLVKLGELDYVFIEVQMKSLNTFSGKSTHKSKTADKKSRW